MITPVNNAPVIGEILEQEILEDTDLTIPVNISDAEGDPVILEILGAPQHGSASVLSESSIQYVPSPGYAGPDALVVRAIEVESGLSSDQVSISIIVMPVNAPGLCPVKASNPVQKLIRLYLQDTVIHNMGYQRNLFVQDRPEQ